MRVRDRKDEVKMKDTEDTKDGKLAKGTPLTWSNLSFLQKTPPIGKHNDGQSFPVHVCNSLSCLER